MRPPALDVRYEDNHLLVVVKPAGLLAQADRTGDPDLLTLARAYIKERYGKPGEVYLGLVHRLDRRVSGLMVLARTSKAAARLSKAIRERRIEKRYFALVEGSLEGEGVLRDHLLKTPEGVRVVGEGVAGAQHAVLRYRARARAEGVTLVEIDLETGRPHQIRVQFSSRGHGILGDHRYGVRRGFPGGALALHSYALSFEHPTLKTSVGWTALPEGWGAPFTAAMRAAVLQPGRSRS